jgi:predicted Zn-dependent peptidase
MVMKVSGVNNIVFRSTQVSTPDSFTPVNKAEKQVKELSNITPDYGVVVPVNYKQTSVDRLDNGLEIYSYKMSNGYKVTIVPMKGSPAVVKSYVNVGSMNETANIKGISHFLEHMAFNGTNGDNGHIELKQGDSFKKIDKIGGWANASTNYAITDYVNSTPLLGNNDLETQIKVIAAMAGL